MTDEVSIQSSIQLLKGGVNFRSYPTAFKDDVVGDGKGPTPGAVTATTAGTNVSLAELTTPGWCRIRNLDETNVVHYGIWDGTEFYPWGQVGPGHHVDFKFSSLFATSIGTGTGTGTYDVGVYRMRLKSEVADCDVTVEAFEA